MEREEAIRRYGNMAAQYHDAEQNVKYNDDPDLRAVWVPLPQPPDWKLIEGYGKAPHDQKWTIPKPPRKLVEIERNRGLTIDEMWQLLENNQEQYADAIDFIKRMWYHRLHGYWFFNNGIPTYITGKHFYYLTSYQIDVGYPKFRNRDREYWIWVDFCYDHRWDFISKDKDGWAVPTDEHEEDGTPVYEMYDVGRRVCYGDVYPKMRREGATFRAECNNLETISRMRNASGGIQSRTDDDAEEVFLKKLVRPWKKVPFYFKPVYAGTTNPRQKLDFDLPSQRVGSNRSMAFIGSGLESSITFGTGDEGYYDGHKLIFYHDDEVGKCAKYDVWKRHNVTKECLSLEGGEEIIGYTSKTSTAGEYEAGGGKQFETMCSSSNYYQRTMSGQTESGLFLLFISSADGLSADVYGMSNVELNTKKIEEKRLSFHRNKDTEGWLEQCRKFPIFYRECFLGAGSDIGFNIQILAERIAELKVGRSTTKRVMLTRDNPGDKLSPVRLREDPNGRWIVSAEPPGHQTNQWYISEEDGQYRPKRSNYFVGADPFKSNQTEFGRMSDGGIAVKWGRDESIDGGEVPIEQWKSDSFVCTYQYRPPTTDEYAEDVLMTCQYWGAMVLAESNVQVIVEKFIEWGFGGYLVYTKDASGKWRKTPGFNTGANTKEQIFNAIRDYIQRRGAQENHLELLEDCKSIRNMKEMTRYDRLTASGLAEIACNIGMNRYLAGEEEEEEGIDMPFPVRYTS